MRNKKVYKITGVLAEVENNSYLIYENEEVLIDAIREKIIENEIDIGDKINIEVIEMSQEQIDKLDW